MRRHLKHQMHESNCIGSRTSSVLLAVPKTLVTTKSTDFSTIEIFEAVIDADKLKKAEYFDNSSLTITNLWIQIIGIQRWRFAALEERSLIKTCHRFKLLC